MTPTIGIKINGVPRQVPVGTRLDTLVDTQGRTGRGFAVAVDGEVVPRAEWQIFSLDEGQVVEILVAVQGG